MNQGRVIQYKVGQYGNYTWVSFSFSTLQGEICVSRFSLWFLRKYFDRFKFSNNLVSIPFIVLEFRDKIFNRFYKWTEARRGSKRLSLLYKFYLLNFGLKILSIFSVFYLWIFYTFNDMLFLIYTFLCPYSPPQFYVFLISCLHKSIECDRLWLSFLNYLFMLKYLLIFLSYSFSRIIHLPNFELSIF